MCLPAALQRRWEVSVAASKCAEWRLWFQTLDQTQQKASAESLCKSTKDAFWAGLWLEYEEWLEPRQTRFVATAARALVILEQEKVRKQILASKTLIPPPGVILEQQESYLLEEYYFNLPEGSGEALSVPVQPRQFFSLGLRLTPCYFRLPVSALRFATQIFRGKSYEEAVDEKKVNFDTGVKSAGRSGSKVSLTL